MQQVRVHGPSDVRLDEVEEPVLGPRDAIVEVAACGVCGSDLGYIEMGGLAGPGGSAMPLGHELAGVVVDVGAEVSRLVPGTRVVVHPGNDELGRIGNGAPEGGLAPRVLVRDAAAGGRLYPIPDELPLEVAALAEPLAVGMHAIDQADVVAGDKVVVFGCGPIGLAAVAAAVDRGATEVIGVDLSARRRELALELGAMAVVDPATERLWRRVAELHGTVPFMFGPMAATDAYIEASGAPSVIPDVLNHARPHARLAVVALHHADIPTSFLMILMKQLTIRGAMEYPDRFESAIELLGRRDLSPMITHRFPLARIDDALGMLGGSKECGKVLITIDGASS